LVNVGTGAVSSSILWNAVVFPGKRQKALKTATVDSMQVSNLTILMMGRKILTQVC